MAEHVDNPPTGGGPWAVVVWSGSRDVYFSAFFRGQDVFGIVRLARRPAEDVEGLKGSKVGLICLAGQNSTSQGETSDRLAM